jgi:hypothetical protein
VSAILSILETLIVGGLAGFSCLALYPEGVPSATLNSNVSYWRLPRTINHSLLSVWYQTKGYVTLGLAVCLVSDACPTASNYLS